MRLKKLSLEKITIVNFEIKGKNLFFAVTERKSCTCYNGCNIDTRAVISNCGK